MKKKIAKYSALVAAAASVSDAQAAIIYTDETPDFTGGSGSQYFLDLNNDGTDDFRIYNDSSNNLFIEPIAAANGVLGSLSPSYSNYVYPYALNNGDNINAGAGTFFNFGNYNGYQFMNYGNPTYLGEWVNVTDRYLGLSFEVGGNTYYGWARLDVDALGNNWVVKDYAYEDVAGATIAAGDMGVIGVVADGVSAIFGADIADNANGTDLETTFASAANEATVSEYRVIAVKAANAGTFDLTAAQALGAGSYVAVTPNASTNYTQIMGSATDSDGDAIVLGQPYAVFVLSIADGTNATVDNLVQSAANVTLNTIANAAINPSGFDSGSNSNASDLTVTFNAAPNEGNISEYRIIAVTDASTAAFDLAAAQALPATAYQPVATGSATYSESFGATITDSDGAAIVLNQEYNIFILSVANGTTANIDSLTQSQFPVILQTVALNAQSIVGSDISDNGNASDLQVDFDAAMSESGIAEYHVIAVTPAAAMTFTIATAQALPATAYEVVAPGSPNYTVVFDAATTDSEGNTIVEGTPYTIFVHSVSDGVLASIDSENNSNNDVTLENLTANLNDINSDQIQLATLENQFKVTLPSASEDWSVTMTDMNGKIISQQSVHGSEVLVSKAPTSGTYIISVNDAHGVKKQFKVVM